MDQVLPAGEAMALRVDAIVDAAQGMRSFVLVPADPALSLPAFTPGAHVKITTPGGAVRSYSLCNDPVEANRYVITVKREEGGQGGSASMHRDVKQGDVLAVSAPENAFPLATGAKSYLFIAGGIGITPILSMIRSFGELAPAPWKLCYLSRHAEETPFLDELRAHGNRVIVHHDEGDGARRYDLWPLLEKANSAEVYCCGPRGLMESVRDMTGHWSPRKVHFESFESGGKAQPDDKPFRVRLARSGRDIEVPVGRSILSALRENGCNAPSSCESGTCGTCRTSLLAGVADHRDMVLLPEEAGSQIMICVSRARGECLELDL